MKTFTWQPELKAHTIELHISDRDISAVRFADGRYEWASWLYSNCEPGTNVLTESQVWELSEAIESDDAFCPLLAPTAALYDELLSILNAIV